MAKRAFDVVVSVCALIVTLPLILVATVLILMESGRPIFFTQERVGRNFAPFRVIKLRTMNVTAAGPLVTSSGDRRVSRVGRVLRATKIDELPQFFNVLRGDMSIVGPRPEVPRYVELYRERYRTVLSVRPGITDLASIRYRNEEQILAASKDPLREYELNVLPKKLDLAEDYIRSQSIWHDCRIILHTALATFRGAGGGAGT
jgi:lipopolysaccharide/colanic/teichoic acid biosynthesis glycosyltransferase